MHRIVCVSLSLFCPSHDMPLGRAATSDVMKFKEDSWNVFSTNPQFFSFSFIRFTCVVCLVYLFSFHIKSNTDICLTLKLMIHMKTIRIESVKSVAFKWKNEKQTNKRKKWKNKAELMCVKHRIEEITGAKSVSLTWYYKFDVVVVVGAVCFSI